MSLPRHIFNHSIIWLVLPVVVALALYVSIGRYFFPLLENYRDDLVLWMNEQLTIKLNINQLDGQWNGFDPYINLEQVSVQAPDLPIGSDGNPAIEVERFSLELDSFSSFRYQFPVIRQAAIEGVTIRLRQQEDESWFLNGWHAAQGSATPRRAERLRQDVAPIARLLEFLLRQQHLKMEHVWLELTDRFGREYRAYSHRLEVYEVEGRQRLQGQLQLNPESSRQIGFIMEVSGDPFDQASLEVDLYLQADSQSLTSWLEKFAHLLPIEPPQLEGGIELWSRWRGGRLQTLQGQVSDASVTLQLPDQPELRLADFNSQLFWQRSDNGWELIADALSFRLQERFFDLQQLTAEKGADDWQVQLADLDLKLFSDTLQDWPGLPEKARDALERLQPRGRLHNLTVSDRAEEGLLIRTELDAVSVDAFYGAPVLRNVNGFVQSSAQKGFIRFDSDAFFMAYPRLYRGGWWFDAARGEVHWEIGDTLRVYGLDLQLKRDDTEVAGEFDLQQIPDGEDLFYLNVGLTGADETLGIRLIPDLILPEPLMNWLDGGIRQAEVRQGGFIYDGTLSLQSDNPVRQVATLLMLDIEQGTLNFLPEWPVADQLSARVQLDGSELDVDLHHGRYLGNDGISGTVTLRNDGVGSVVGLDLEGRLKPEPGWQLLTQTPLSGLIPDSLLDWQLSGAPLALTADLTFPVDGRKGHGEVVADARDNRLLIPELNTPISALDARVHYDLDQGLTVDQGHAEFLDGPARFSVSTDMSRGSVQVTGDGQAQLAALHQWQPMPFSPWLTGDLDYQFNLSLDQHSQLHLSSDLEQVAVALPEPLGKAAGVSRPLMMEMRFSAEEANRFNVAYGAPETGEHLVSHGIWGGADKGFGVGVWWGDSVPQARALPEATGRTDLYIRHKTLDLAPWVTFAEEEMARQALADSITTSGLMPKTDNQDSAPVRFHLATPQLHYDDYTIHDLTLDAELSEQQLEARIASRELDGHARISPQRIAFDLERVFLASGDEASADGDEKLSRERRDAILRPIFKQAWPDIDLSIGQFDLRGKQGSDLRAGYRADADSRQLILENLSMGSVRFNGRLDWMASEASAQEVTPESTLVLNIQGGNLGDVQRALELPQAVTSSRTDSSVRLNWQGLPHELEAETLDGQVILDLEKGGFEQVESVSALKILSLLNFESLIRRLRLDFSDLSGKGLSYDKVSGRLVLDQGIGTIVEPIRVEGTATEFEMTGQLDFIEEQFDQEMVVTLPVGETLPFAAVMAGAPQIGGTIYIVQKVFGNLFNKFTRATYTIRGDWSEPQIELKRVF